MKDQIEPQELSGLLDGELDSQRAANVRRVIETDAALQAELARLVELDRAWSLAAGRASFNPRVTLSPARGGQARMTAGCVLGLAVLAGTRFLSRATGAFDMAVTIHVLVLVMLVAGLIWLNHKTSGQPDRTIAP